MKELKGSRLFVIAIVCGLIAAALLVFYMKQVESKYRQAAKPKKEVMVTVVVPRANMTKGDRLTKKALASRNVPEKYLPANAILAKDFKKVANRTLLTPVQIGRPITWEAVTGTASEKFSEVVELGRRAMTIKVSRVDSFDGLLRPGDMIDLMGVFELKELGISGAGNSDVSDDAIMPVLEKVEVLEASREDLHGTRYEIKRDRNSTDGFNMEFTMITLNLSPRQVARVQIGQETGDLFAVLRHPKDTSNTNYEYLGVDLLLTEDKAESIDLVLDENGKPIGRIVGDNVVDENGNIIGKVVDGKAVGFDGKPLGQIVNNVDPNDPVNRIAEVADVVRDANGNIIGRIVDGKVVDNAGNVIGEVKNGQAVGLDGQSLGRIDKGVALDKNGNEVDTRNSSVAAAQTRREQVVRDANGNIVGRIVDGKVVDSAGRVIGTVDKNGRAVSLDGRSLGTTEEVLVDRSGNIVGQETKVVRDANGKIIGKVVDGKIIDSDGNIIGEVGEDGIARSTSGERLGVVETAILDKNGKELGRVSEVVRDKNGNIIGRVVNGKVIDADGNIIGKVAADGSVVDHEGNILGTREKVVLDADGRPIEEAVQVIRDAQGNIIGKLVDGKVVDKDGKVIGEYRDGQIVDANGNVIHDNVSVNSESQVAMDAELKNSESASVLRSIRTVDFIAGGTAKDGITPVTKVRAE
jgi:Flp pilus assembly protein CpaB